MANFCLPKQAVDNFTNALRSGKIDPEKLKAMTSEERRNVFKDIVGPEGAKQVNSEFEARTLLKNQKYAYTAWAKKVAGITPEARKDLSAKIQKLDHVLSPEEEKSFLHDLASTKLGANVTSDEAKKVVELSDKVEQTRGAGISTPEQAMKKGFTPTKTDLDHGYAKYDLQKYVSDLKNSHEKFHLSNLKTPVGVVQETAKLPRRVADLSKSIGASLDDSFALRQGSKALLTHPKYWQKEFRQSFVNLAKGAKNAEAAQREFKARIMADPMYDQAVKDKLAITGHEDVFPTSAPGKIPIAGRAFNASEVAYDAYAENLRLALYKNEMRLAQDKGLETAQGDFGKNVAKMVNSLTGRGGLGRLEPVSGPINVAFYSLRFLKSNIDTLLLHPLGAGVGGTTDRVFQKEGAKAVSYAQKRAAYNLVKIIAGTAAILGVADKLKPGSVQWDPRSSDFGKIKVGDTRFEVTGGLDSLATLASRLVPTRGPNGTHPYTRSTTSNSLTQENTGNYGSQSTLDTLLSFVENKTSPVAGIGVDLAKGQTHNDTKPTVGSELGSLVEPLNVKNYTELKNDKNSANILTSVLADTLGVSTNTYGPKPGQLNATSKQANELDSVGYTPKKLSSTERNVKLSQAQQDKANKEANSLFAQKLNKALSDPSYKSLSPAMKKKTLSEAMSEAHKKALDDLHLPKVKAPKLGKVKSY
jgi:hypothetical protein